MMTSLRTSVQEEIAMGNAIKRTGKSPNDSIETNTVHTSVLFLDIYINHIRVKKHHTKIK